MTLVRVCSSGDVEPAEAMRVELDDSRGARHIVAVVRDSDGSWHALGDTCSHDDYSLSEGDVDDGTIDCYKHGAAFDLKSGRPLTLPATTPVPVYAIEIKGDDVFVDVDVTL
ncbi:MAG: non-heme iron oxygenase ferredoxin subunit [Actinomycetaceae bacterium]|nr:non-heme iron oxygenase ferredoxin subunit [Actinomycetaceae bacterium]